jgi:hypothetical protein
MHIYFILLRNALGNYDRDSDAINRSIKPDEDKKRSVFVRGTTKLVRPTFYKNASYAVCQSTPI